MIGGSRANWANRPQARLLIPIREMADHRLTIRALPFAYPQSPQQTMQIEVNGRTVEHFDVQPDWQEYTTPLPAPSLHAGLNEIVLRFRYAVRPRDVLPPNYAIGTTGATSPVDIVVNSGEFGSIQVNGREVSPLGRGYNVVVIDPRDGSVKSAKAFNTTDDRAQSRALTDFIASIPKGLLVAVASQEEVAGNLGDNTVKALRTLGAQTDIWKNPDYSHALIGVKGAGESTALEQAKAGPPFLSVGHSPDERTLATAVSTVAIEKK